MIGGISIRAFPAVAPSIVDAESTATSVMEEFLEQLDPDAVLEVRKQTGEGYGRFFVLITVSYAELS